MILMNNIEFDNEDSTPHMVQYDYWDDQNEQTINKFHQNNQNLIER